MARFRKAESDRLIEILTESCEIMWRAYDSHLSLSRSEPEWERRASEIFTRCMTIEQRLRRLKHIREQLRRKQ